VWHVKAGQLASDAEVGVKREESLAHEWWSFEIRQDMCQEVSRVGVASVEVRIGGMTRTIRGRGVVEDDDFVDGEDGEGAGKATWLGHALLSSNKTR
jgi:hypothetical protein